MTRLSPDPIRDVPDEDVPDDVMTEPERQLTEHECDGARDEADAERKRHEEPHASESDGSGGHRATFLGAFGGFGEA